MKNVISIHRQREGHWVGDGFPVHTVFHYQEQPELSPFLLLDHAGPHAFAPSTKERGVGWHPHRGFETVTIVYDGEVDHHDTAGHGGRIAPGDVQWMTAGSGLLHKEYHSPEFTQRGGTFEVLQLWVNLPREFKMTAPRYQPLSATDIPVVAVPASTASVRVIAGAYHGVTGPAKTFTPINLLDARIPAGERVKLDLGEGFTAALYVLKGDVVVNGDETAHATELVLLDRHGSEVTLEAQSDATVVVLNGAPIEEPIAGYGPFVMNTKQEIHQAFADFQRGRFGTVPTEREEA
ncbi:MAG TPA: pirin family protein [Casimicrobiaceae bacterium]|nr:pirin family protein [Casimicrobiaceae bacterium]